MQRCTPLQNTNNTNNNTHVCTNNNTHVYDRRHWHVHAQAHTQRMRAWGSRHALSAPWFIMVAQLLLPSLAPILTPCKCAFSTECYSDAPFTLESLCRSGHTKVQPCTVSTMRAWTNYEYICGARLSCSWCPC